MLQRITGIVLIVLGTLLTLAGSGLIAEAEGASARRSAAAPRDSAALERGRRLTRWLYASKVDSVAARMAPAALENVGGREGLRRGFRQVFSTLGEETETLREDVFSRTDLRHYYRVSRFSGVADRTVTIHWAWREDGDVVAVRARPTPETASTGHADYRTKTDLRLPFTGAWYVFWGGRLPHQNRHARARDQRFAYDFVVLEDGSTHTGDGAENADYPCFGRPVVAPAAGRVVGAVDSVPDNRPGRMNRNVPPGNHVVIDHGNGEYSLLAHFRHGSVSVEEGDRVEAGQRLGTCGNSGNSSEPHLHYHLQDGPRFGRAVGLPAPFRRYRADGEPVERGEPVRGQIVRPGAP